MAPERVTSVLALVLWRVGMGEAQSRSSLCLRVGGEGPSWQEAHACFAGCPRARVGCTGPNTASPSCHLDWAPWGETGQGKF